MILAYLLLCSSVHCSEKIKIIIVPVSFGHYENQVSISEVGKRIPAMWVGLKYEGSTVTFCELSGQGM